MSLIRSLEKLPIIPPSPLIGRESLLAQIGQGLAASGAVLLFGVHGIGKHAIAATLAATHLSALGSVLWLTAWRDDIDELSNQVLRAYGLQGGSNRDDLINGLLSKQTPLVILDGNLSHETAAQFIHKYTSGRTPTVIIQETAADGPWSALLVPCLDEEAALMFYQQVGNISGELQAPVNGLIHTLAGHPLSLKLAALNVGAGMHAEAFLAPLAQASHDDTTRALAVILACFNRLEPAAQGLLLAMSATLTHGISAELLRHLVGNAGGPLCSKLIERGFLVQRPVYYHIHPLIQSFALDKLYRNGQLQPTRNRMLDAMLTFTQANLEERGHAALLLEMDNLINAAYDSHVSGDTGRTQTLLALFSQIEVFIYNWGYQREIEHLRGLVPDNHATTFAPQPDLAATLPTGTSLDKTKTAESTRVVVRPDETTPRKPKAFESVFAPPSYSTALATPLQNLQISLNEAAARHDRPTMARLYTEIGTWQRDHASAADALGAFSSAVSVYQEIGDVRGLLGALEGLAEMMIRVQGPAHAIETIQRGLNVAESLGDGAAGIRFLVHLGDCYSTLGDSAGAMSAYKRAVKLARRVDDEEATGITLNKLAAHYMDAGRFREAAAALTQAIRIFEDIGRRDLLGRSLGNLGTALGHLERWHEAGQKHNAALKIARQLGDRDEELFQLRNLAFVADTEGHYEWAVNYSRQALYLALRADDEPAIADLTFELGNLLMQDVQSLGQAVVLLEKAAALHPDPDTLNILKEAREQFNKRQSVGLFGGPIERDILAYASAGYPHASGPPR